MRDIFFIVLAMVWVFLTQGLLTYMSPLYFDSMRQSGQLKNAWNYYRSSVLTWSFVTGLILAILLLK